MEEIDTFIAEAKWATDEKIQKLTTSITGLIFIQGELLCKQR
jgi:hypothetical protein